MTKNKAIILDRDGTINVDKNYLSSVNDLELHERADEAIRLANLSGVKVIVVSNQSGIGRGMFTKDTVEEIHSALDEKLSEIGAKIDKYYYCVHAPEENCNCRKPKTFFVEEACKEFDIIPETIISIGDKLSDVKLAQNVGGKGVLLRTGHGINSETKILEEKIYPDLISNDLRSAIIWALGQLGI